MNNERWQDPHDWIKRHVDISFATFVDFVLYEASLHKRIAGVSWHWWSFTDICKVCQLKFNFIGKIETFRHDVNCLLNNFPEYHLFQNLKNNAKSNLNSNSDHDKQLTLKYFSELTKNATLDLYTIYKFDFQIGGYDFPKPYIDVAKPKNKS